MVAFRPIRYRNEKQVLVLSAPISYHAPLNELHTEYPKHVQVSKNVRVIVNNPAEEEAALNGAALAKPQPKQVVSDAPVPFLTGANDQREMLLAIARKRGVHVDERWPTRKITKALERAFPVDSEWQ